MSRRTTGVMLVAVAAQLFSMRYLAAAIFGSGISSWSSELFNAMLQYVGPALLTWSRIALVAGLVYLVWVEIEALIRTHNKLSDEDPRRNRND